VQILDVSAEGCWTCVLVAAINARQLRFDFLPEMNFFYVLVAVFRVEEKSAAVGFDVAADGHVPVQVLGVRPQVLAGGPVAAVDALPLAVAHVHALYVLPALGVAAEVAGAVLVRASQGVWVCFSHVLPQAFAIVERAVAVNAGQTLDRG